MKAVVKASGLKIQHLFFFPTHVWPRIELRVKYFIALQCPHLQIIFRWGYNRIHTILVIMVGAEGNIPTGTTVNSTRFI